MHKLAKLFVVIIVLLPFSAMAHGYWIETEGSHKVKEAVTIKLFFGEYVEGDRLSNKFLDRMTEFKVWVQVPGGGKQAVIIKQLPDYWEGSFIPQTEGSYEIIAINNEREVQDWTQHNLGIVRPIQYLKTVYQVGKTITPTIFSSVIDVNVVPVAGNKYEIRVTKDDSAFRSAVLIITHPDGWQKTITTDKEGKAIFAPVGAALYLIDVEWIDKTPGSFKEKSYATVRHKYDYSFYSGL